MTSSEVVTLWNSRMSIKESSTDGVFANQERRGQDMRERISTACPWDWQLTYRHRPQNWQVIILPDKTFPDTSVHVTTELGDRTAIYEHLLPQGSLGQQTIKFQTRFPTPKAFKPRLANHTMVEDFFYSTDEFMAKRCQAPKLMLNISKLKIFLLNLTTFGLNKNIACTFSLTNSNCPITP